jgi:hypothetical protein
VVRWDRRTNLCNFSLHDKEIRIVDVQLDGLKELLDEDLRRLVSVDEILGEVGKSDLISSHQRSCSLRTRGLVRLARTEGGDEERVKSREEDIPAA